MEKLKSVYTNFLKELRKVSTCKYYDVAAIVVDKDTYKIVSLGYNGVPSKVIECNEVHDFLNFLGTFFIIHYDKFNEYKKLFNEENSITLFYNIVKGTNTTLKLNEKFKEYIEYIYNKYIFSDKKEEINKKILKELIDPNYLAKFIESYYKEGTSDTIKKFNIVHSKYETHAEQNALSFIQVDKNKEYIMFISHLPCYECAKLLKLYNVKELFYQDDYIDKRFNERTDKFLENLGIVIHRLGPQI